ncbi:hypothetical protein [Ahrensia kielensis]|uniref:hypothetical protein n=1 Tax=Ahrensia kielensis TaxID=76980 RepID=UPI00036C3E08|nr:hypothetical protein [Ahrensia kielensis]
MWRGVSRVQKTALVASWIKPAGHIWIKSKQDWVVLPQGDLTYEGQPENYDALICAYQRT